MQQEPCKGQALLLTRREARDGPTQLNVGEPDGSEGGVERSPLPPPWQQRRTYA